jgi:hypothetical protein
LELRDVDSGNKQTFRFGAEEAVESMFINFKFLIPMLLDDAFFVHIEILGIDIHSFM